MNPRHSSRWIAATILMMASVHGLATDLERTFVEVLAGATQPYLVASFMRASTPTTLKRQKDTMDGGNDPESAALRRYYDAMIRGRPEQAASVFLDADGSRQRFRDGLTALPTRYAGYQSLSEVTVAEVYGWGPYRIAVVSLLGSDGRQQNWREALVCMDSNCLLSNAIDAPDDGFALLARVRNPQTTSNRTQAVLEQFVATAASAQVVPTTAVAYPGVEQHPLTLAVRLDTLPRPVNVALPHVGRAIGVNRIDITPVVALLSDLIGIDIGAIADPSKLDGIEQSVRAVIDSRVDPETAEAGFYFVSAFAPDGRLDVEWYHPIAALQRVHRWQSIRIIGLMVVGQEVAVFYQPTQHAAEDGAVGLIEPVQVAVLRRAPGEPRVLLGGVGSAFEILHADSIARLIGTRYGAAVTFAYPP